MSKKKKYNKALENINRKRFRRKLKSKRRRKKRVIGKQKVERLNASKFIPESNWRRKQTLEVPKNFSLLTHLEDVIKFIELFKSYSKISHEISIINLEFKGVKKIDTPAISLLLSSIKELGLNDINITGNLPECSKCSKFLVDSGFIEHMGVMTESLKSKIRKSNPSDKNMMLMKGRDKTNHRDIGLIIKKSVEKLTGVEAHYKSLYGVIGEMNINSLEHAYKKSKHWVFSVRHDKENDKINFSFADNGFGIYRTLSRNIGTKAFGIVGLKTEKDIVEGMFKEEYSSRFKKQFNRNKGLPAIRNLQIQNKVDNLIVLTNKTFINFKENTKLNLNSNFSGTFYYWELSKETYEKASGY